MFAVRAARQDREETTDGTLLLDKPVGGWTVWFLYAPREIQCPTHGRVEERLPWADPYARVTYRHEYVMLCVTTR